MPIGQDSGDSAQPLTIGQAAQEYARLLSLEEDPQEDDSQSEAPEAQVEETEESSEEPAETTDEDEEAESPTEDESEETDEEPEEKPVQPRTRKLKVDGEEIEVTDEELEKGYSRTADYTRKTQKHAENVRAFEAEKASNAERQQQLVQKLTQLDEALTLLNNEPDWDTIRRDYPAEFPQVHADWQLRQQRLNDLRTQKQQAEQEFLQNQSKALQQHMASENEKLLAKIPTWSDKESAKKEQAQLVEYAAEHGFSKEELSTVADHRAIVMLRKAMLFDQAEKAKADAAVKAAKKIEKVKTAKPGSPSARPKVTDLTRAKQRLAKTHSLKDAAAAYSLMLSDD